MACGGWIVRGLDIQVGCGDGIYLIFARDSSFAFTTRKNQDLVYGVDFVANVSSNRNLHRHKLAEQPGMQDFSELPKSSHFRSELGEVDHLMLRRG